MVGSETGRGRLTLSRAIRANGIDSGTSENTDVYSFRKLSFWVWA